MLKEHVAVGKVFLLINQCKTYPPYTQLPKIIMSITKYYLEISISRKQCFNMLVLTTKMCLIKIEQANC